MNTDVGWPVDKAYFSHEARCHGIDFTAGIDQGFNLLGLKLDRVPNAKGTLQSLQASSHRLRNRRNCS